MEIDQSSCDLIREGAPCVPEPPLEVRLKQKFSLDQFLVGNKVHTHGFHDSLASTEERSCCQFKIKYLLEINCKAQKLDDSEAIIQDLLQELRFRMPNQLYKYTDKLEEGDLIKYRERLKVKELAGKK